MKHTRKIHYGVDFDRTLAHFNGGSIEAVGKPLEPMVGWLKEQLEQGHEFSILTARVAPLMKNKEERPRKEILKQKAMIHEWLLNNGLPLVLVTSHKMPFFDYIIDDKAIMVIPNTGKFAFTNVLEG